MDPLAAYMGKILVDAGVPAIVVVIVLGCIYRSGKLIDFLQGRLDARIRTRLEERHLLAEDEKRIRDGYIEQIRNFQNDIRDLRLEIKELRIKLGEVEIARDDATRSRDEALSTILRQQREMLSLKADIHALLDLAKASGLRVPANVVAAG